MNKLTKHMLFLPFLTMFLGLQSMEEPEAPLQEEYTIKTIQKSPVIIFGKDLQNIEIEESLLACSKTLIAKLEAHKRKVRKSNDSYYSGAISLDLSYDELLNLKKLIDLSGENEVPVLTTEIEEKLVREFQINPMFDCLIFYETCVGEETQNKVASVEQTEQVVQIEKPSILKRKIDFLHQLASKQSFKFPSGLRKPKKMLSQRTASMVVEPPNKQMSVRFEESKAFQSYENLICEAIRNHNLTSLKKILNPIPFTRKGYETAFKGTKSRFDLNKMPFDLTALIQEIFSNGADEIFKFLVEQCDLDLTYKDKDNSNFLIEAASCHNCPLNIIRYLVSYCNLDPHETDNDGTSPLHSLFCTWPTKEKKFNKDVVNYFIKECGINPSIEDGHGMNCLHFLSWYGLVEGVRYFIEECKVDHSAKTELNITPLHLAVEEGHLDIVKLLVEEYQVNVITKDKQGRSPIDDAATFEIKSYLLDSCVKSLIDSNDAKCPICLEDITNFKEGEKLLTACCYKSICKEDFNKLQQCPLCRAELGGYGWSTRL
jgi:hypothetical protein